MNVRNDWSFLQRRYETMMVGASVPAGNILSIIKQELICAWLYDPKTTIDTNLDYFLQGGTKRTDIFRQTLIFYRKRRGWNKLHQFYVQHSGLVGCYTLRAFRRIEMHSSLWSNSPRTIHTTNCNIPEDTNRQQHRPLISHLVSFK